jgi:peptidyl-prolyl cis-trans isomerase C
MSKIKNILNQWAKQPVVKFMGIGLLMFLINTYLLQADSSKSENEYNVSLTAGEVKSMEEVWLSKWKRPATKVEMEGMINQRVEEAILFREAIKIGLDKNDDIIRQRMAQKLEFLSNDLVKPDSANAEEVKLYFDENIANYTTPENITIIQLFVNPKTHGDLLDKEVNARLAKLKSMDASSSEISKYADQFSLQTYYPEKPNQELAKLYGSEFATKVFELETNKWFGPINSQYGVHLIYVMHKNPAVVPEFENVKEFVTEDLQREKQEELNGLYIEGILSRYNVIIEDEYEI